MSELVSIIVPVYNSEKYLERCISSICNQTYLNFELLLVDDGSTDSSAIICKKFEKIDKRIKYFFQNNSGSSSARNYGIEKATGKFIMFVDSDDSIDEDMLTTLMKLEKKSNDDFIISGIKVIDKNNNKIFYNHSDCEILNFSDNFEKLLDLFVSEGINGPVAKIYKKSLIDTFNIRMPLDIHLNEDLNFNVDYLKHCKTIFIDSNCFYNYFHNGNESVTSRYYKNRYEMLNDVNDNVLSFFFNAFPGKVDTFELKEVFYLYVKIVYSSILNLFHPNCKMSRREKKEWINKLIKSDSYKYKIKNASKKGIKYKLLLSVLKTKSVFVIYYFCKLINFLRKKNIAGY